MKLNLMKVFGLFGSVAVSGVLALNGQFTEAIGIAVAAISSSNIKE